MGEETKNNAMSRKQKHGRCSSDYIINHFKCECLNSQ